MISVFTLVLLPVILLYQSWAYHVFRARLGQVKPAGEPGRALARSWPREPTDGWRIAVGQAAQHRLEPIEPRGQIVEAPVDLRVPPLLLLGEVASWRCVARATKVEVIAAVTIATSAIASSMTNAATMRPATAFGVTSP